MSGFKTIVAVLLVVSTLSCGAAVRKNNISIGAARRELGVVAAFQNFPEKYRIDRYVTLQPGGEYYHIYVCELRERSRWRTLVFANSGDYLGYYETIDPPVDFDKDALVFPGPDFSAESGDYVEEEFDSGNAYVIQFSALGPPDLVKFESRTFSFVSSPRRIRPEEPAYRFGQVANRMRDCINSGRYGTIREDFSPEALARIPEERTATILEGVRKTLGRMERVGDPWIQAPDTAILPITFKNGVAGLKLTLSDEDKIIGMWVLPFKTAFPDIGKNRVPIRLPFDGRWRVMWGGDTRDTSKYFGSRVSHNAREFVIANRFGKTYRSEGAENEDYYAYRKTVRAPAAGTVVAVIDGVADNPPNSPNPFDRLGNAVMIEHSTTEYSVVGHLLNKSIVVKVGERVAPGLPLGQCGNSGDSSQPSVYFHLQDSKHLLAGSGYRPVFNNLYLTKEGKTLVADEYEPMRGDYIQQRSMPVKKVDPTRQFREAEAARNGLGDVEKALPDAQ